MRIALLADYYGAYLADFHSAHRAELMELPFAAHAEVLFRDYFGSFISYRNHFRKLGHTAQLLIGNYYPLQQKWLDENDVPLRAGPATKHEIVLAQLAQLRPDVFFMGSMFDYYGSFLKEVSRITPNIFTWISCPYPAHLNFSHVRCVLSSAESFVQKFRGNGINSEPLKAAFDREILSSLEVKKKTMEVSFVGGLSWSTHQFRMNALETIIKAGIPLRIWGYRARAGRRERLCRFFKADLVGRYHQGELWGLAMYRTLAESRITLNMHIDIGRANSVGGNMRLFEATGCGALIITDFAPDVPRIFEPDQEVVTYREIPELCEKVRYYLDHSTEAAAVARAGQEACLKRHNYSQRIREFAEIIEEYVA